VHSGKSAAAFTVDGEDGGVQQARCALEGTLPVDAYYGAWFYIPALTTNNHVWNLFHFQAGSDLHGLWDVSLSNDANGNLNLYVLNFLWVAPSDHLLSAQIPVPIGSWFHVEFHLKRAKDATGEAALYQDGQRVVDFGTLVTDNTDSTDFGQWFAGNLADSLLPPESTLYVDDVTIEAELAPR